MAGLALDILDLQFIRVDIPIAHGFGAGMAIDAIQCIFAFCELGDRLIIIMQSVRRLIGTRHKRHRSQLVIAAVVAGVALCEWHNGCKRVDLALWKCVDVWGMTGSTAGQPVILLTFYGIGVNVAGLAVGREFLDEWVFLCSRIKRLEGC